ALDGAPDVEVGCGGAGFITEPRKLPNQVVHGEESYHFPSRPAASRNQPPPLWGPQEAVALLPVSVPLDWFARTSSSRASRSSSASALDWILSISDLST